MRPVGKHPLWDSNVEGKVRGFFARAGREWPSQPVGLFELVADGQSWVMARVALDWGPAATLGLSWPYEYAGFHGTTAAGLLGILRDRAVRASEKGSRAVYVRAQEAPGLPELTHLLAKVLLGSKGADGIALHVKVQSDKHLPLRKVGGGVESEAEASKQNRVTSYPEKGGMRWTFPEPLIEVRALWIDVQRWAGMDPEASMLVADSAFSGSFF